MKWFKRWFANKCREAWEESRAEADVPMIKASRGLGATSRDVDGEDQGLNIIVRAAVGGRIVSFRHHDQKSDRYYWKTYVIPEDLDFERELGKMITLESMRM